MSSMEQQHRKRFSQPRSDPKTALDASTCEMWIYACNYQFPVKCADGCLRVIYMKIEFPPSEHPPGSTTMQRQPWYVREFALERFQTLKINWKFRFVCVWRAVSKCFCSRTRHRDESTKAHTTVFIIRRINGFAWAEPTDETTRGISDVLFRTGSWYMVWAVTALSVHLVCWKLFGKAWKSFYQKSENSKFSFALASFLTEFHLKAFSKIHLCTLITLNPRHNQLHSPRHRTNERQKLFNSEKLKNPTNLQQLKVHAKAFSIPIPQAPLNSR